MKVTCHFRLRNVRRVRAVAGRALRWAIAGITVLAIVVGDGGLPLSFVAGAEAGSAHTAVDSAAMSRPPEVRPQSRCGCANAGTRDCCCARRVQSLARGSCCRRAPTNETANAAATNDDSDVGRAFVACACGNDGPQKLILNHQPRLPGAVCVGVEPSATGALALSEPVALLPAASGPEPRPPRSLG